MGPAQYGKSTRITGLYGYRVREQARNLIIYQPNNDEASDFSVTTIQPMLRYVPRVSEMLLVSNPDQQHKFNNDSRKVYKTGATAYCLGARAETNLNRRTADDVFIDDWDAMDRSVKNKNNKSAGSVRARAFGRTKASPYHPNEFLFTTPNQVGESFIYEAIQACSHVFKRHIPCPGCGQYQHLVMNLNNDESFRLTDSSYGLIYDEYTTIEKSAKTARYRCKHCTHEFLWEEMLHADKNGVWRSDTLEQIDIPGHPDDGYYFEIDDEKQHVVEDPVEVAYCCTGLTSEDEDWTKLVTIYLRALRLMEQGDDSGMIAFFKETIGDSYLPPAKIEITADELMSRLEQYDAECPWNVQCILLVVDVQQTFFDYEFIGTGALLESWGLMTGKLHGNTNDRNDHVWQELDALQKRTFEKANGERLGVKAVFIDARYRPDEVIFWCEKQPLRRMPVQGQPSVHHPLLKLVEPEKNKPNARQCWLAKMGPVKASDRVYTMLAFDEHGAGYMHFPLRDGYFEEVVDKDTGEVVRKSDYFNQLTADEKHLVRRNGQLVEAYIKPDGKANEKHDLRKIWCVGMEAMFRQSGYKPNDEHPPPYVPNNIPPASKPPTVSSATRMAGIADAF